MMTGPSQTAVVPSIDKPYGITQIRGYIPIKLDMNKLNYDVWREVFETHCSSFGVLGHLDGSSAPTADDEKQWKEHDGLVKMWIYGTVSEQLLDTILKAKSSARDIWITLEELFRDNKEARALQYDNDLRTLEIGDMNVTDYSHKLKSLSDLLASLDSPVTDRTLVMHMLNGLSDKFDSIINVIQHQNPFPSFTKARSMLLMEEKRLNKQIKPAPLVKFFPNLNLQILGMEKEYPKRLFSDGSETQVQQINNSCRMSIMTKIKTALPVGLDGDNNESDNSHAHGMKRKTKHVDHGAETRKKRLLCERASTSHVSSFEDMKSFIKDTCSNSFGDNIDKRFVKLEDGVSIIKDFISPFRGTNSCELLHHMSTQHFLHISTGHLSRKTQFVDFDPPHDLSREGVNRFTPFNRAPYVRNPGKNEKRCYIGVCSEDRWNAIEAWSRNPRSMNFGPVVIDHALLTRIIGQKQWLRNQDMDATMYLFRENTSLGRLKSERVGFMDCMFSVQITEAYKKFLADKKNHTWDSMILAYANGEIPAHGKTRKKWALDFDKIYTPVLVNNNHWIALCINFVLRTIEVFDCYGNNYERQVEPFAITIPWIVKEIQPKSYGKNLHLSPYSIIHVTVPQGLNKSHSDCGVYALKYIESHLLQLGTDLINDDNIMEARMRIAVDLWEAASVLCSLSEWRSLNLQHCLHIM